MKEIEDGMKKKIKDIENGFSQKKDANNAYVLSQIKEMLKTKVGNDNGTGVGNGTDVRNEANQGSNELSKLRKKARVVQSRTKIDPQRVYATVKDPAHAEATKKVLQNLIFLLLKCTKELLPLTLKIYS